MTAAILPGTRWRLPSGTWARIVDVDGAEADCVATDAAGTAIDAEQFRVALAFLCRRAVRVRVLEPDPLLLPV